MAVWLFGSFFASIAWNDSEQCQKNTLVVLQQLVHILHGSLQRSSTHGRSNQIPHLTPIWMQQIGKVQGRSKARDKTSLAQKHNNHQTISDTCHIKLECFHTLAVGKSQNATAQRASLSAILQKHRSLALGQHPPRPNNDGRDVESSTSQREFINFQWYSKTVSPP